MFKNKDFQGNQIKQKAICLQQSEKTSTPLKQHRNTLQQTHCFIAFFLKSGEKSYKKTKEQQK